MANLISKGIAEGWTDGFLRARIAEQVGLSDRDANALENLRQGLEKQGATPGQVRKSVNRYRAALIKRRAQVIAQHEIRKVTNDAQRIVWKQAQQDGDLSPYAVRVIKVHKDGRQCRSICAPYNGRRVSLKSDWGPPFHPNCRCEEDLVDEGVTKTVGPMGVDLYVQQPMMTLGPAPSSRPLPRKRKKRKRPPIVEKHLPGLHDQRTHGHRHGFASHVLKRIEEEAQQPGARGGFAKGMLHLAEQFPHIAVNVIDYRTDGDHRAAVGPGSHGHVVKINPQKLADGHARLLEKIKDPHYEIWGIPEAPAKLNAYPQPEAYGYAVAAHEFGHLAHMHYLAVHTGNKRRAASVVGNHKNDPALLPGPPITPYAKTKTPEAFAEWFAAWYFDLVPEDYPYDDAVLKAVLESFDRQVEYRGKVLVKNEAEDIADDDFTGSVVETVTVTRLVDQMDKVEKAITPGGRVGDASPFSTSRTSNWVARAGGLPKYIRMVAHALIRHGKPESTAISMAVGIVRNWAEGKGKVSPKVRAAAAKAIAEWEAKKAKSHVTKAEQTTWNLEDYVAIEKQLREDGTIL